MKKILVLIILFSLLVSYILFDIFSGRTISALNYGCTSSVQSTIEIPVIDADGEAQMVSAHVSLVPGTGRILLDLGESYIGYHQAQPAIRNSVLAAQKATGISLGSHDVIISFSGAGNSIEGDSLGAPLAIAVSQALMNQNLTGLVTATGTVSSDGKIGPVGKIFEKAKAAKSGGLDMILVPPGSSFETAYTEKKVCTDSGNCSLMIEKKEIHLEKETGIRVIEVYNISEALKYISY